MRRALTVVVVAVLAVGIFGSGALAATSLIGTEKRDVISGTGQNESISGLGGDDTLNGFGGKDLVKGGEGPDEMSGGYGPDTIYGNAGDDNLIDAPDKNRDFIYGGSGNDLVQVRDVPAVKDVIHCGPGRDTAYVDRLDVTKSCERVKLR